jgi:glyoxylase-like metal-dependent hydrolase (beta-lactamase superfamily II)
MAEFKVGEPVRVAGDKVPVHRVLGRNAGPMTGPGTNSYLVGDNQLALIDPGPADETQIENFIAAIGERELKWIFVTHTHGDHSPAAKLIAQRIPVTMIGIAAPESGRNDMTFEPDRIYSHGEVIDCGDFSIELIHTPGHVSNHFCYLLREEKLLFTGDHILQGTTSVILPPDGSMSDYMNSLGYLYSRDFKYLAPGHGDIMEEPAKAIEALINHRTRRENKIINALSALGKAELDPLTLTVYDDVAEHLLPWAKLTLEAHLLKLQIESKVELENQQWKLV